MRKVRYHTNVDYGSYSQKVAKTPGSGPSIFPADLPWDWIKTQLEWLQTIVPTVSFSDTAVSGNEVFESSEHRRPQFNSCFHTVTKSVNYMMSAWWFAYGASRPNWSRNWRFATPTGSYSVADVPDFTPITSNMQAEAYHSMIPRFEGDLSLVNFIFEMKDFRDLSTLITEKSMRWMRQMKFTKPSSYTAATKRLAELHLTNNFVIDPLAQDLASMVIQAQQLVMDAQEDFRNKGLQPNIRHFSKQLNQSQNLKQASGLGSYEHFYLLKGSKSSSTFTATMEGDYGYQTRSNLEAFTKYWGLELTAQAVWNGTPFSFLADYFINIGHSLDVMRHDKNVKYNVRQYSESLLNTVRTGNFIRAGTRDHMKRAFIVNKTSTAVDNNRDIILFTNGIHSTSYCRRITAPYWGPYLPTWQIPSGKQGLNMAALLRCLM